MPDILVPVGGGFLKSGSAVGQLTLGLQAPLVHNLHHFLKVNGKHLRQDFYLSFNILYVIPYRN